jgi:hypothetical protein
MEQLVELKGLGDEVERATLDGVDGTLCRPVTGDHDADDAGVAFDGSLDDGRAIDARHAKVADDDVEGMLFEQIERLLT